MENEEEIKEVDFSYHAEIICLANKVKAFIESNRKHTEHKMDECRKINESIHSAIKEDADKHEGKFYYLLEPLMKYSDDLLRKLEEEEKQRERKPCLEDVFYDEAISLVDSVISDSLDNPPF